jgi:AcrR family transcriptional regulator
LIKHVPQETRRIETKRKITDAAILLFASRGYYKTTSKQIAKAAGVSTGSFYKYYADKKVLLIDVLNAYIEETMPLKSEALPVKPIDSIDRKTLLRSTIRQLFESHHFTEGFRYQIAMLSSVDKEIGSIFKDYQKKTLSRIKETLLYYLPDLEAVRLDAIAIVIYSAIEGTIHSVKFSNSGIAETLLQEELVCFIDSYVMGCK